MPENVFFKQFTHSGCGLKKYKLKNINQPEIIRESISCWKTELISECKSKKYVFSARPLFGWTFNAPFSKEKPFGHTKNIFFGVLGRFYFSSG